MSEHRLQHDMIECGLLPRTGTTDDAVAALRGLRLEARADRMRTRTVRTWIGPALVGVLATAAVMLSWSALAVLPVALGLIALLGYARSAAPRREATAVVPRLAPQRQKQ